MMEQRTKQQQQIIIWLDDGILFCTNESIVGSFERTKLNGLLFVVYFLWAIYFGSLLSYVIVVR